MFDFLEDLGNYKSRKVDKTHLSSGLVVSTAWVSDVDGYETALMDLNGIHPVERYESKEEAEAGHKKWCLFGETAEGAVVLKLPMPGSDVESREITIKLESLV